jgi:tRNA A-37 threonylcarbamoyl transferase component Bud32
MALLVINPRYRSYLEQRGLDDPDRLQALPAVIVSGHPDRNVAQVTLGDGPTAVRAFLKREHRIPWKTRLAGAWAGFGLVSKSVREFRVLQSLRTDGIDCPEPIAAGEDRKGRAFLLIRELTGALDLRVYLRRRLANNPHGRRRLARDLGEALARIHDAGFDHPDLYTKHILVDPATGKFFFLDWQRSRRHRHLSWSRRWRDLAALDATLASELASPGDRWACLRAYVRACTQIRVPRSFLREAAAVIGRHSQRLQQKRRIRELRQAPLAAGTQNLVWLNGEALCVTRAFQEEMRGQGLDWLQPAGSSLPSRNQVRRAEVCLPRTRHAHLVRRWSTRPLRWLWACLCRRPLTSPELEQAGTLFRLQRFGVGTPRLLAVGQSHPRPWQTASFLLTAEPAGAVPLTTLLAVQSGRPLWTAERKQRRRWIREAGQLVRRLHDAGCHAGQFGEHHFLVHPGPVSDHDPMPRATVALGNLDGIHPRRHFRSAWARRDLAALLGTFVPTLGSRTDALRFFLAYLGLGRLTPAAKRLAAKIHRAKGKGEKKDGKPRTFSLSLIPFARFAPAEERAVS